MTININFDGLTNVLCRFGIHRWQRDVYPKGDDGITDYEHPVIKYCVDCRWEVRKK